jgi:hypothetical protein
MQKTPLQKEIERIIADPATRLVKHPDRKISRQLWSLAAGAKDTYVKDLLRKPNPNPSAARLQSLAAAVIGLHPQHFGRFLGGTSALPPADTNLRSRDPSIEGSNLDDSFHLTQSATNRFGDLLYIRSHPDAEWGDHEVERDKAEPQDRRLLRVETDRMAPRYLIGETVALERATPKDGDHVWIEMKPIQGTTRQAAMLRLLKEQDSATLTLVQYMPRKQTTIERRRIAAIYRVLSGDDLLMLLGAKLRPT